MSDDDYYYEVPYLFFGYSDVDMCIVICDITETIYDCIFVRVIRGRQR
jgi:hypothetical protein